MCVEAKKAIYGTIEAALLFWKKLSKILEEMGYQRNGYYWCFVNKKINDKQCNILWRVEKPKISHFDPDCI